MILRRWSSTLECMSIAVPSRHAPLRLRGRSLRTSLRKVAEAAVTPLELDDVLDVFHPLRAGAELRGRIVEVRPETAESATLVIKPGRDWRGHVPGQYVRVGVDVDGVRLWRTYSLTHGPRADRCISITVKAIPDGVVSNHLVHRARAGQMIQLAQAQGEFVLPQPIPPKLLLVTAGSGITPVIGMLRNLFSARRARRRPTSCCCTQRSPAADVDLRRRAARRTPPPAGSAWSSCTPTTARPARRRRPRHHRPRPGRAARRTPAGRPACSTRSRSTTPRAA